MIVICNKCLRVSTASDRPKYNRLTQYFLSLLWIFVVTVSVFFKETGIMLVVVVGLVAIVNIVAFIAESSKDKNLIIGLNDHTFFSCTLIPK